MVFQVQVLVMRHVSGSIVKISTILINDKPTVVNLACFFPFFLKASCQIAQLVWG
eukprot:gnl/Chilomastix_caulleri/5322.p2 GENE.gnl/Chilomastix_caulleri/5322~~gnl/Chilomastix_caulleri/5322.p2  ORF type:complete len:55 (-),score=6.24 gnl/Chilomastix_caulleri/5322:18-182(-)